MHQIISQYGFVPLLENPEKKLAEFLRTSLEKRLSKTLVDELISNYIQKTNKSADEILLNPELFSKAIEELFGEKVSKLILKLIQEDLFENGMSDSADNSIKKILDEIRKNSVLEFIQKIKGHEHIAFFWANNDLRRYLFSEFFKNAKSVKGFISMEGLDDATSYITYDELFSNKSDSIEKEKDLIISTHKKNTTSFPTLLGGDNCDRWFEEGLGHDFLKLEKYVDKFLENESISCICGYNELFLSNGEHIGEILSSHKYVILDNPLMIYKRREK